MIVHPDWRGGGAGSTLLKEAIALAEASGCSRITFRTYARATKNSGLGLLPGGRNDYGYVVRA